MVVLMAPILALRLIEEAAIFGRSAAAAEGLVKVSFRLMCLLNDPVKFSEFAFCEFAPMAEDRLSRLHGP